MAYEIVTSPITWAVVGIAFIGSLFACRGLADRIWFALIIPLAYGALYGLCLISICAVGNFLPNSTRDGLNSFAIVISTTICFGIFVLQVFSMAKDPRHSTQGYSIGKARGRSLQARAVGLQDSPMRKRMSG